MFFSFPNSSHVLLPSVPTDIILPISLTQKYFPKLQNKIENQNKKLQ